MKQNNSKKNGLTVRDFREDLGLSRTDVRLQTGVAERSLSDIEAGRAIPKLENLLALTRLYKKPLKEMISALGMDVSGIPDDIPSEQ